MNIPFISKRENKVSPGVLSPKLPTVDSVKSDTQQRFPLVAVGRLADLCVPTGSSRVANRA